MSSFLSDDLRKQVVETIAEAMWDDVPSRREVVFEGYSFKGLDNMDDDEVWVLYQELDEMFEFEDNDLVMKVEAAKAERDMLTAQRCMTVECQ